MEIKRQALLGNSGLIDLDYSLIGSYRLPGGDYVLIDTGLYESVELVEQIRAEGHRVRAVLCTHLHIDHVANNYLLQQIFGTEIYASAPAIEHAFQTKQPQSPPGCPPPCFTPFSTEDEAIEIDGLRFPLLYTPGHSRGHMAIVTPDGLCCVGDCLVDRDWIRRLKLPYLEDVDVSLLSMEALRGRPWPLYLISHKSVARAEEMPGIIDANVEKELYLMGVLRELINAPMTLEDLYAAFFPHENIHPQASNQHWLRRTLDYRVDALVKCGDLIWQGDWICPAGNTK